MSATTDRQRGYAAVLLRELGKDLPVPDDRMEASHLIDRLHLGLSADAFSRKRLSRALGPLVETGEIEAVQRGKYRRT